MNTKVQAYLSFEGRCEEALEFYKSALGAVVGDIMRFKEMPGVEGCAPGDERNASPNGEKIMHASFTIGETQLMASDGRMSAKAEFKGISLAITVPDDAAAKRRFDALAVGGAVLQPMTPAFFTTSFGMVADKFGVTWMIVSATVPKAA